MTKGTTPAVQYTYADGADVNGRAAFLRLTDISYPNDPNGVNGPNGQNVHYNYNTGVQAAVDDIMSRLSSISDSESGEIDAAYTYLGAGTIAVEDYAQSQVKLDYDPAGDNSFTGLDRFGRVVDQIWTDYGADPDAVIDHYQYEYDRAGNRVSKTNELDHDLDETYVYDNVDRLKEWYVGDSETPAESWNLDALGNNFGAGTYNAANEETPTGQSGDPYDAAGNMITLQSGNSAIYDAWNRLKEVGDASGVIEKYEYDGLGRRVRIFSDYSAGVPTKVVDEYHNRQQVIESEVTVNGQRAGGYQYLWSPRYVDAPILRDTLNAAGTSIAAAERIFYLGDANYNVTAVVKQVDIGGGQMQWQVVERYSYDPYGVVTVRAANGTALSSNRSQTGIDNTILYTGKQFNWATLLQYNIGRYYDPRLQRFINRDPIGYTTCSGELSLYQYAGGNPIDRTDPDGLRWVTKYDVDWQCFTCCMVDAFNPAGAPVGEVCLNLWNLCRWTRIPQICGAAAACAAGYTAYCLAECTRAHQVWEPEVWCQPTGSAMRTGHESNIGLVTCAYKCSDGTTVYHGEVPLQPANMVSRRCRDKGFINKWEAK